MDQSAGTGSSSLSSLSSQQQKKQQQQQQKPQLLSHKRDHTGDTEGSDITQQEPNAATASRKKKTPRSRSSAAAAAADAQKRRCVSTACVACRKRKSKCDGAVPSCAACSSVYGTECVYDPSTDHRRKGVYKEKVDSMKARNSTLQILIEAILNGTEDEAFTIVRKIRTCDSLDIVAEQIINQELDDEDAPDDNSDDGFGNGLVVQGERELARKMGELRLENGSVRFIGGTSHLIYLGDPGENINEELSPESYDPNTDPITTWTRVTQDPQLITHLIDKYFAYHYPYFTTLSKKMFFQDYLKGRAGLAPRGTVYCSSLLVNAMLALGCHFSDIPEAYGTPGDSRTKGDHFFAEAKRLIIENDEYEKPRLVTVQALALMSVREAGCAREAKGWVYSGMAFRMAQDIGLNLEVGGFDKERMTDHEIDARRITFWGCFLFDKAWSNYLGRLPLLPTNSLSVSKFEVFPDEDAEPWCPFTDNGYQESLSQPSRTRAVALQMSKLCEISSDLLLFFYHPNHLGRSSGKAVELKKLSELHRRLEEWRHELPQEFEPKDGQLPNVILMHMFFHLQYIHLFRPFLRYAPSASPLPQHVSPRRICTVNAGAISKLMRLYKKSWNLRQICNIAVYMIHSACTIHLLNLPEKTARRDIIHGVKHLEEIAEDWLCARRTLSILSVLSRKWNCELPEDAAFVFQRTDEKYGYYSTSDVPSPRSQATNASPSSMSGRHAASNGQQRDISPLGQYTQSHTGQQGPPMGSLDALSGMPMPPHHQMMPMGTPRLDTRTGGAGPLDNWTQQPSMASILPEYQPSPTGLSPDARGSNSVKQGSPAQGVTFDPPDWFFNDSARWQQSFETWNMGGNNNASGGGSPVFIFGGGGDVSGGGGSGGGGAGGAGGDMSNMRPDSGEQVPGFEGLGASLNNGGWLPQLD